MYLHFNILCEVIGQRLILHTILRRKEMLILLFLCVVEFYEGNFTLPPIPALYISLVLIVTLLYCSNQPIRGTSMKHVFLIFCMYLLDEYSLAAFQNIPLLQFDNWTKRHNINFIQT